MADQSAVDVDSLSDVQVRMYMAKDLYGAELIEPLISDAKAQFLALNQEAGMFNIGQQQEMLEAFEQAHRALVDNLLITATQLMSQYFSTDEMRILLKFKFAYPEIQTKNRQVSAEVGKALGNLISDFLVKLQSDAERILDDSSKI